MPPGARTWPSSNIPVVCRPFRYLLWSRGYATVDECELMALVICAFNAAEVESAFDVSVIEKMPPPFLDLLNRVRTIHSLRSSIESPYDTFPDGWEAAAVGSSDLGPRAS